ncbi:MAG: tRNA (adenosine(37)-N6)-dimethylallyltransferase MiaA [Spirochaetota bacterium]|nr:MAG: tRNA (adenosine(37)-N6)-dimethylallyltransferase MiaA [Spirochaetota bacterium]
MKTEKLVFIFGPTGVGKSELAVKIAHGLGEIISVDSMQVYEGLDCGTAKPDKKHLVVVKHHLVSIVPPTYRFSAGDFKRLAQEAIVDISKRGFIPILVGGTGLYFRALEYNMDAAPKADINLREQLYKEEERQKGALFKKLMDIDPSTARRLHPNDLVRIIRALEIYHLSGVRFSDILNRSSEHRYSILKVGINIAREKLYRKLEVRCMKMVRHGLAWEVSRLLEDGLTEKLPSMQGLGYSHFTQYYKGCLSHDETLRLFTRDTKRYAKRQLTWFGKEQGVTWYHPDEHNEIRGQVEKFCMH